MLEDILQKIEQRKGELMDTCDVYASNGMFVEYEDLFIGDKKLNNLYFKADCLIKSYRELQSRGEAEY